MYSSENIYRYNTPKWPYESTIALIKNMKLFLYNMSMMLIEAWLDFRYLFKKFQLIWN